MQTDIWKYHKISWCNDHEQIYISNHENDLINDYMYVKAPKQNKYLKSLNVNKNFIYPFLSIWDICD